MGEKIQADLKDEIGLPRIWAHNLPSLGYFPRLGERFGRMLSQVRDRQTRLTRPDGNYNLLIYGDLRFLLPLNHRPIIAAAKLSVWQRFRPRIRGSF